MTINRRLVILAAISLAWFGLANRVDAENRPAFYDLIERSIEGWTVMVDPQMLNEQNREEGEAALKALANHLQRVKYIVPEDRTKQLQELRIWIDWHHDLGAMQYHPDRGWLIGNGYDPRLVKHVHLPRAKALLSRGQWAKHPYVVLHELAHSFHDQVNDFYPFVRAELKQHDPRMYDLMVKFWGKVE